MGKRRTVAPDKQSRLDMFTRRAKGQQQQEEEQEEHVRLRHLKKMIVLPESDIGLTDRRIWIITTASLPWLTGTSINPLLRAAVLTHDRDDGAVTLVLPFLRKPDDQQKVFPKGVVFSSTEEQEQSVRDWLEGAGLGDESKRLRFAFYEGRYDKGFGSILPAEDITKLIPPEEADVCILEEPEHLNWQRPPGQPWTSLFSHVIGIVHTNYLAYSAGYTVFAPLLTFFLRGLNKLVVRGYTDKVVKLSAVIQELAPEKEVVCNVHGVRTRFLEIGDQYARKEHDGGAYFIGKSLWAKGYKRLFDIMKHIKKHDESGLAQLQMDLYGSGPDRAAIERQAKKLHLPVTFHDGTDHANLDHFRVFVNPSVSEVLCTTIAEALAMAKWVVCARHPSNAFFYQFPNCLPFETAEEFASNLAYALRHQPQPLSKELRHMLTWEAATDRLVACSTITVAEFESRRHRMDRMCETGHRLATKKRKLPAIPRPLQVRTEQGERKRAADAHRKKALHLTSDAHTIST